MTCSRRGEDPAVEVRELDGPPNLTALYARATATALRRSGGTLPDTEVVLDGVEVHREHLAAYDRVCGFTLSEQLPPTYLHVRAFPLQLALMADRAFPFPLPGLVHVANRVEVERPARAGERFRLAVRAQDLRAHPRGQQVDLVADATVGGEQVWRGVSTYLRRGGTGDGATTAPDGGATAAPATDLADVSREGGGHTAPSAVWRVPADRGRRYAAVSGDRNPIHLNRLAARAFGFPRTIAHGMWTKARCLSALEGRLPDAFTVEVAFKSPLLLPSVVEFRTRRRDGGWAFAVHDRAGKPHLLGEVTA